MIEFEDTQLSGQARIKVIGVGGGGNNAVKHMIDAELAGIDFFVVNTDLQALQQCHTATQIQIGASTTDGLGAGANPDVGRKAAEENIDDLQRIVSDADMVFVTAGMGGGTGTGAAPVVAGLAKDAGALTIGVVTRPFRFEGRGRELSADQGLEEMRENTDSVIVIPNQRLMELGDKKLPLLASFRMVDDILLNAVQSISDMIQVPGAVNLDFADIKTIMQDSGTALMGVGFGTNDDRAQLAAQSSISSPLLEQSTIEGATGVIVNFTASPNFAAQELENAMEIIGEAANPGQINSSQVIFGLSYNEDLEDELYITVIATGFDTNQSSLDVGSDMPFGEVGYTNPMQTDRSVRPSGNPFAQTPRQKSNMNSMRQTGFSSAPTRAQSTRAVAGNLNQDTTYMDDEQTFLSQPKPPHNDSRSKPNDETELDKPTFLRVRKPSRPRR